MATMVMFLVHILAKVLSIDNCMSAGSLPAALSPIAHVLGSCSGINGTCTTPPAMCPSSSCCITTIGLNRGKCGCLTTSGSGTQTCSDPKTQDLVVTEDSDGEIHVLFSPWGKDFEQSIVQTVSRDRSTRVPIAGSSCFLNRNDKWAARLLFVLTTCLIGIMVR